MSEAGVALLFLSKRKLAAEEVLELAILKDKGS